MGSPFRTAFFIAKKMVKLKYLSLSHWVTMATFLNLVTSDW